MQLTGPRVCSILVMPIPLAIIRCPFSRLANCHLNVPTVLARRSHICLWSLDSTGTQEALGNSVKEGQLDEIRVPSLVFDYPRHSGATDEE
jgi:hypothetical protein